MYFGSPTAASHGLCTFLSHRNLYIFCPSLLDKPIIKLWHLAENISGQYFFSQETIYCGGILTYSYSFASSSVVGGPILVSQGSPWAPHFLRHSLAIYLIAHSLLWVTVLSPALLSSQLLFMCLLFHGFPPNVKSKKAGIFLSWLPL